jgi:hypothetical protein
MNLPPNPNTIPTQPPMVAVKPKPAKPIKECNCDQEAVTVLATQVQKLTLLIAQLEKTREGNATNLYQQLTKIEDTLTVLQAQIDKQPTTEEIAKAVQKQLVLPYRVVDEHGKPTGEVIKIPLDNETPASFRLRWVEDDVASN